MKRCVVWVHSLGIIFTSSLESDRKETYDIFTADDSAKYLVYGWVKFSEVTHQKLTLIHFDKNDKREVEMTADQTQTVFFVFAEMPVIKNTKLSLFVPGKLKSCTDSRFHVYKVWSGWLWNVSK